MTTQYVPLEQVPSQQFNIVLNGQDCAIKIYQKDEEVFCDMSVSDVAIWKGIKCLNLVEIKPSSYMGFNGSLYFKDLNGNEDPLYTGFGDRWVLVYGY